MPLYIQNNGVVIGLFRKNNWIKVNMVRAPETIFEI